MKILMISPNPLDVTLGAPKVLMELAPELERLGHQCHLVSDLEVLPTMHSLSGIPRMRAYSEALREYLARNAGSYDIADYDHLYLPFDRKKFSSQTLFVARSVLLFHHFYDTKLPRFRGIKPWLSNLLSEPRRRYEQALMLEFAQKTCKEADLVNVSNDDDVKSLVHHGLLGDKIATIPFGITENRLNLFEQSFDPNPPKEPKIAFVGTFDLRKGAREFPGIVERIIQEIPNCRFLLAGARYRTTEEILKFFPRRLHHALEITPHFEPDQLPRILSACSVGVFPSHIEGFGFGVLEMLGAGLPVVAYRAPGPPMMLKDDFLVPRGDTKSMTLRLTSILRDSARLKNERLAARQRARDFLWSRAGELTSDAYLTALTRLRSKP